MKNLKKLSRKELKKVNGGLIAPGDGNWCCCNPGGCSTGVYGNVVNLYCSDPGTYLSPC